VTSPLGVLGPFRLQLFIRFCCTFLPSGLWFPQTSSTGGLGLPEGVRHSVSRRPHARFLGNIVPSPRHSRHDYYDPTNPISCPPTVGTTSQSRTQRGTVQRFSSFTLRVPNAFARGHSCLSSCTLFLFAPLCLFRSHGPCAGAQRPSPKSSYTPPRTFKFKYSVTLAPLPLCGLCDSPPHFATIHSSAVGF